jgi:2-dehydropantoate 2-reductase
MNPVNGKGSMEENLNVTVLGAGAMGCTYGAMFQAAGCDVLLLDIWQEHIDQINTHGLSLVEPNGESQLIPMQAASTAKGSFRRADLVIIFVDTNALDTVLPLIEPLLLPDGFVLTLQNGVGNLEKLSAVLGESRVVAGTSMNSCELIGPGRVRHVIHGTTIVGEPRGSIISKRVQRLGDLLLKIDDKIELVRDIEPHIWSKLIINCAVNPLCALTGLLPGQLQNTAETRHLQELIVSEIFAVCQKKNIILPESDPIGEVWRKSRGGGNKPSMVQHLERGRKTEIDALNGAVVRIARVLGIHTPVNEAVTGLIKGLTAGHGIDKPKS